MRRREFITLLGATPRTWPRSIYSRYSSLRCSSAALSRSHEFVGRRARCYPPSDSILIDDPRHIAELGFFLLLSITGSKVVASFKKGPLKPPLRASNLGAEREFRAIQARLMDLPAQPVAD